MSTETIVKKRTRSKKLVEEDEVVTADSSPSVQAPAKKTRTRKAVSKPTEEAKPFELTLEPPKTKKPREVKKKETPKPTTTMSTSKRAAKTSDNGLQLEDSSSNASQILKQATAFADGRQEASKDTAELPVPSKEVEEHPRPTEATIDPMSPATLSGKLNKVNSDAPGKAVPELESTESASRLLTKPSSFLNSFLNEPEPAPVHPPQERQERTETPEESRAGLKQVTKHDFEDSILSPRGTVKLQSQSASQIPPPSATAIQEPSASMLSSAQLRAFTTSSFAALKAGSHSKPATSSKATPSKPAPTAPSAATTFPPKAHSELRKPPSKPPPPSSPPPPKPSFPKQPLPPPSTAPPSLRAYPSGSLPQSPPRRPPPTPPPRPTDLSYDQLQKNAQYKSLRRRWTAVMVSIPFLVGSSYELWRRWDRGDFGRRKMERDTRVVGVGIEEELRGFDRATAAAGGARGRVAGRLRPEDDVSGELGGSMGGQKTDVVVQEGTGMEAVSGRQQSIGAVKDIEDGRQEGPVLGRLPGIEIEAGPVEPKTLPQEGGAKRGWVQVFK